jgi:hypothetical protein
VSTLPQERESDGKPLLRKATVAAIIGISYLFALRIIGTFLPQISQNIYVVRTFSILAFCALAALTLFFYSFRAVSAKQDYRMLTNAATMAIIGSVIMVLVQVWGLMHVFGVVRMPDSPNLIEAVFPWVTAVLILFFFVVFFTETVRQSLESITNAVLAAVLGATVGVLVRTYLIITILVSDKVRWFADLSVKTGAFVLPLLAFGFAADIYFYVSFYRKLK